MGIRVLTAEDVAEQREEVIVKLKSMFAAYIFESFTKADEEKQFCQIEEEGDIVLDQVDVLDFLMDVEDEWNIVLDIADSDVYMKLSLCRIADMIMEL